MRLFTAVWPSREATRHLHAAVEAVRGSRRLATATEELRNLRFLPPERWHLTLCFYGDDADQDQLRARLDRRLPRLSRKNPSFRPPRLRFASAGLFRGVLWAGVVPAEQADAESLRALVHAAGADPHSYRGHVTVARWARGKPDRALLTSLFANYVGPWWEAFEVALVRSDQQGDSHVYRTVHRAPVVSSRSG